MPCSAFFARHEYSCRSTSAFGRNFKPSSGGVAARLERCIIDTGGHVALPGFSQSSAGRAIAVGF